MSKYVTYSDYKNLYGDIEETTFNRLVIRACAVADKLTTGADGIRKLKEFFPTDTDDIEVLKSAICGVIHLMADIEVLEAAEGYTTRSDGTVVGKKVTSISSGSESLSYSTDVSSSMVGSLVGDIEAQSKAFKALMTEGLRYIQDANGVNLMYMGAYPAWED